MKNKLKNLQTLVAVALYVVMTFSFASCKNNDTPESGSLAGTSWKVVACTDHYDFEPGMILTFQKDGNMLNERWEYAKWTQTGTVLKIVAGQGYPDDCMEGIFTINGDQAVYQYSWYDYYTEEWDGTTFHTVTLKKL